MCLGIEIHPGLHPFSCPQVASRLPPAQDNPFFPVRAEVSKPFAALTRCPFWLSLSKPAPIRIGPSTSSVRPFDTSGRAEQGLRYLSPNGKERIVLGGRQLRSDLWVIEWVAPGLRMSRSGRDRGRCACEVLDL